MNYLTSELLIDTKSITRVMYSFQNIGSNIQTSVTLKVFSLILDLLDFDRA